MSKGQIGKPEKRRKINQQLNKKWEKRAKNKIASELDILCTLIKFRLSEQSQHQQH